MKDPILRLILLTTALRLLFGWLIGLGVDESYMAAAGRTLSLGYFDHPPAAWWLSWSAAHLFGSEAPLAARLPFILLFAQTTWLIARIATHLGGARAGYWAAVTLNLSPVLGVTSGSWVLPDGPLDCALAGAALCLLHALDGPGGRWGWWAGAGVCAGLALFSKYSAALTIAGAFVFLLVSRAHRPWLRRPQPYAAAALAVLVFSPVILWNATHHWASFAFQSARAGGLRLRPLAPLETLGGEALFILPWLWLPLLVVGAAAFRGGDWRGRLLACLAAPPILVFALISAWSSQRILYHWAAPGYLLLFPLLGCFLAAQENRRQAFPHRAAPYWAAGMTPRALTATAVSVLAVLTAIGVQVRTDAFGAFMPVKDPTAEGVVWTSLRDDLTTRGLLKPGMAAGVPNWRDAGKIAHALGADVTVLCLNPDARQFGVIAPLSRWAGEDVLILSVGPLPSAAQGYFQTVEMLPDSQVTLHGRVLKTIGVAWGRGLKPVSAGNGASP